MTYPLLVLSVDCIRKPIWSCDEGATSRGPACDASGMLGFISTCHKAHAGRYLPNVMLQ